MLKELPVVNEANAPWLAWQDAADEPTEPVKGVAAGRFERPRGPKPEWLKVRARMGPNYQKLRGLMRGLGLHTICEEAKCPNIYECWEEGTATFLILGSICTRACGFCNVLTGKPTELDWMEPFRVAEAVETLGLKHAVVTSVNRDDLADGGAAVFAKTIEEIRRRVPDCSIEVLIPDFEGNWDALKLVMDARPDILNHNIETVARLYRRVRTKAVYERSLELLQRAKDMDPEVLTKSGIMVGLGETKAELLETMRDLVSSGTDILTIGQYLRPTLRHLPVVRYYTPEEFEELRVAGEAMGFRHVESGPLVRSSYRAGRQTEELGSITRPKQEGADQNGEASEQPQPAVG